MMFVDLVDLEDLSTALKELGIELPDGAASTEIGEVASSWLGDASEEQKGDLQVLLSQLADKTAEGHVLPDAVVVINQLNGLIKG